MPARSSLALLLAIVSASTAFAEERAWKNADGTKSIRAEFIAREASSVRLKLADGKELSIDLARLHADDKKWLDQTHPAKGAPLPDENAVFDTLKFGDKHDAVLAKLKASKFVEMTMAESMIGRTGLNGIFRIRQKIGGQQPTLFFDWDDADALKEINVRTAAFPAASYDAQLGPCWKQFIELLTTLHGKPLQAVPGINLASIPESGMLSSHLWRLDGGGSALLGVGCEGGNYQVVVRFTGEKIEPAVPGRPAKPAGPQIDFNP